MRGNPSQKGGHILRQGAGEAQLLPGNGVEEGQLVGVKGGAGEEGVIFHAVEKVSVVKFSINVPMINAGTNTIFSSLDKVFAESCVTHPNFTNKYPIKMSVNKNAI